MDNTIKSICFSGDQFIIEIGMWDGETKRLNCKKCYGVKEKMCIGKDIGDIIIVNETQFKNEVREDTLSGSGSEDEVKNIRALIIFDAWNERSIIEVLAEDFRCSD